jgi:four helix bundle protein
VPFQKDSGEIDRGLSGNRLDPSLDMAQSIICARSFEFAARILRLCDRLGRRGPIARHIGQELAKCGTSIGANAEEAQDGQTKPDFIAKLAVSRKESRETIYWLRLALRVEVVTSDEVKWEMEEAAQLRAMIVSAIKTAQSSRSRG